MPSEPNRFTRQEDLVPRTHLAELSTTVIGVGAIGRNVALQLAAIGVPRIQLVDFDTVDDSNCTTQGYALADVGMNKALATLTAIRQIDPTISVETVEDRYRPRLETAEAVFCCVDSIEARAAIWRPTSGGPSLVRRRMLGEVIRILTVAEARAASTIPRRFSPRARPNGPLHRPHHDIRRHIAAA